MSALREGCECPTHHDNGRKVAKRDRCTERWIRCNEAANVWQEKRRGEAQALLAVLPIGTGEPR